MKWFHNLAARQREESTGSIPIHTHFGGKSQCNEIWSAKKKKMGQKGTLKKDHFGK